jgi:hypothetical protein
MTSVRVKRRLYTGLDNTFRNDNNGLEGKILEACRSSLRHQRRSDERSQTAAEDDPSETQSCRSLLHEQQLVDHLEAIGELRLYNSRE